MSYSIAASDIVELSFVGKMFQQTTITVLHYVVDTAPPGDDAWNQLKDFLDDIQASLLWTSYLTCVATNWAAIELRAQVVAPTRRPVVVRVTLDAGTGLGPTETTNLAGVVTKRTDVITHRTLPQHRGGVGGVHVPSIPDAGKVSGTLAILQQNRMADFGAQLLLSKGIGGTGVLLPCLWHRDPLSAVRFDVLQQFEVQDSVRVMRRRTLGLGI